MPASSTLIKESKANKQQEKVKSEPRWVRTSPSPGVYLYSYC